MQKTELKVGDVINLWQMGKWKILKISEDFIHLQKEDDPNWEWDIFNLRTHPQYKMLIKAKEGKTLEQIQKEIKEEIGQDN